MTALLYSELLAKGTKLGLLSGRVTEARQWFRDQAAETTIRSPARLITEGETLVNKARPGFMYMFQYDPKTKQALPYYDRFPLVFPFKTTSEGFQGINLHYLPSDYRAQLMDSLYALTNNKQYNETTKLRLSYQILESSSRFRFFKPCVKQYLNSHVKSRMLFVPAEQWDMALFLPTARFVKSSQQKVHADSRRHIKKYASEGNR
jgi:hypothetical protein